MQSPHALSQRLHIGIPELLRMLESLQAIGLVRRVKERWVKVPGFYHLPATAPMTRQNHFNWRMHALERCGSEQAISFSAVYSLSYEAIGRIQKLLTTALREVDGIVEPSSNEEVAALCLDFFRV